MRTLTTRYSIAFSDSSTVERFFTKEILDPNWGTTRWIFKSPEELFETSILEKFPEAAADINDACGCYVMDQYMASVFHAMRIVEIGLLKVASLVELKDAKPSWGAVLGQLDKYAFKMKFDELPDSIKPHRERLKSIIPRMQAIQHAWRNKVDHATLTPTDEFNEEGAKEILNATQSFMRSLAKELT